MLLGLGRGVGLLIQKSVQAALKTGEREIIAFGLLVESMSGARLFARRRAEFKGDNEQEDKNP